MTYPLINGAEINGTEGGGSGHTSTAHGTPKVVAVLHAQGHLATKHGTAVAKLGYDTILRPTGVRGTRHGIPTLVHTPVTVGMTVLQAASSGVVTRHGTPVATSTRTLQAVGAVPSTQHGTPNAVAVLQAHGHLATQHGTPSGARVMRPAGHCGTAHGAPRVTAVLHAAGHIGTKHGTPVGASTMVLEAHGHIGTQHGTPRVGVMTARAFATPPSTRHGRALIVRNLQC